MISYAASLDFREAWATSDPGVKQKFPVCPRCGSPYLNIRTWDDDGIHASRICYDYSCPDCDFSSLSEAGTEYDLFEKFSKDFDKESKRVDRIDAGKQEIKDILSQVREQINRLKGLNKSKKFLIEDGQMEQVLKTIKEMCEEQ